MGSVSPKRPWWGTARRNKGRFFAALASYVGIDSLPSLHFSDRKANSRYKYEYEWLQGCK